MEIKTIHLWCAIFIMTIVLFCLNILFEVQVEEMVNEQDVKHILRDMCKLNPEDTERGKFMEIPPKEMLSNISANYTLLPTNEKEKLLKTFKQDMNSVIKCKDNHELFNQSIYMELNLFYIFESQKGPQLVRNTTSFDFLGLNVEKVKCNYSLIKSDADSNVDDSKFDIPLPEESIGLEYPHTSVGVTCNATIGDLRHLLDPEKNVSKNEQNEVIMFYFDVLMYIYNWNGSFVDCGGHTAANCSQCSTEEQGCNGQCFWTNNNCDPRGDKNVPPYSVLILAIDSISRFSFSRNLPKTLEYLKNQGGIVLNKHHRQGENTFPNMMATFTGHLSVSGSGTMISFTEKYNLDWAWDDWRNAGLPNMYHVDMPQFGMYNSYGRHGWKNRRPFMLYHRSAYHAMDSKKYKIRNNRLAYGYKCMGNTPSYKRQFALWKMFAKTFKDSPSFGVLKQSEYTHDTVNLVKVMDDDLLNTLKEMIEGGYTKKALVVVMGDHGKRYGIPGKGLWQDANSPMMLLLLPETLKKHHPQLTNTLLKNSQKLTTMQDIHMTITDPIISGRKPKGNRGGMSLFLPIPSRTCEEASVKKVFCMCPHQEKLNTKDPTVIKYSKEIIENINEKVSNYSHCHPLRLNGVEWATKDKNVYHIQLLAQKNEGEDSLSVASFQVVFMDKQAPQIVRTDLYDKTAWCIKDKEDKKLHDIKPFCICKSKKYFYFF